MRKKDKFEGEKILVLPEKVIEKLKFNNFAKDFYITDIGYFPKAKYHYREREDGCPEHILIFCITGSGWIEINGIRDEVSKNQYMIIPGGAPHKYGANYKDPWTIYWVHFAGKNAEHFILPYDYPRELSESVNSRFEDRIALFEEIYYSLEEDFSDQNLEYSSVLLIHLLGSLKYLSQFRKAKDVYQKDVISNAIVYMKDNMQSKISIENLANHVHLSVSHFCLLFKKKTSHSPIDYLTFLRMQKACSLLDFTSLKINEIAPLVGYEDAYYFTRVFKKVMKKSPLLYRKSKA